MPAEFVLMLSKLLAIARDYIIMLIMKALTASEVVLRLIMFAVILSEFAPMAMLTEVRSVVPPAPDAIAAVFAEITTAFD